MFIFYQVRGQILDTTPQKDRAALSQSKGLQNRRLPSNVAGKVTDDYSERRRCNTHTGGLTRSTKKPAAAMDNDSVDGGFPEITMSEEERKQKVCPLKFNEGGKERVNAKSVCVVYVSCIGSLDCNRAGQLAYWQ